jgi:hypothetical protein
MPANWTVEPKILAVSFSGELAPVIWRGGATQVRGLADATKSSGQGRGRTADFPLFRGSIPLYDHDPVTIKQPSSPA